MWDYLEVNLSNITQSINHTKWIIENTYERPWGQTSIFVTGKKGARWSVHLFSKKPYSILKYILLCVPMQKNIEVSQYNPIQEIDIQSCSFGWRFLSDFPASKFMVRQLATSSIAGEFVVKVDPDYSKIRDMEGLIITIRNKKLIVMTHTKIRQDRLAFFDTNFRFK